VKDKKKRRDKGGREKGKAETEDWTADAIDRISLVPLERSRFTVTHFSFSG